MERPVKGNLIALAVGILLAAVLGEIMLRVVGFTTWDAADLNDQPITLIEDEELGWRNKPGTHTMPPFVEGEPATTLTIDDASCRFTGTAADGPQTLLVGGSYTQGWGLDDEATFAWRLQENYPERQIINCGTGGFGTYQSLLMLERRLQDLDAPEHVMYGFIHHHEVRNAAAGHWLRELAQNARRGHVAVPYGTLLPDGTLERHPPLGHVAWPLRESLAFVPFAERAWMRLKTRSRFNQRRELTVGAMMEMRQLSEAAGASFIVVLLAAPPHVRDFYANHLPERGVDVVDCQVECTDCEYSIPRSMMIPGDTHPNAELNGLWAQCMAKALIARRTGF